MKNNLYLTRVWETWAVLALLAALPMNAIASEHCGDSDKVFIDDKVIVIQPTGVDDTENIQCSLDYAAARNIPRVQLTAGNFIISKLLVENFNGALEGVSRTSTSLVTQDNVLDCDSGSINRHPAVIKFVGGRPTLRYMNITIGRNCPPPPDIPDLFAIFAGVHFTGRPADASCGNDVVFGEVDRVDFSGPASTAVLAAAEGVLMGGCNEILSGTMKVNRSTFEDFVTAVETSMRASSPVEIRFSEFTDVGYPIVIDSSNQDTVIAKNTFNLTGYDIFAALAGILVTNPVRSTTLKINDNQFFNNGSWTGEIALFGHSGTVNVWITRNVFESTEESDSPVIYSEGVDGAIVSSNTFKGSYLESAISLYSANGWSIADNAFMDPMEIRFGSDVSNTVFGPGQQGEFDLTFVDDGFNNFILVPIVD